MIDVGRNYQSMASLKKQLDIMAAYKLNKFHWHLTDRPACRIESKQYPELIYSHNHRQTRDPEKHYTYDEIREIKAMIGFETALRANKIHLGVPELGSWDPAGGNIWVNNKAIKPPHWDNAGWNPSKQEGWGSKVDQEIPWEKQDFYWTREPSKIQLNKGWNKVFVKIPRATGYQN